MSVVLNAGHASSEWDSSSTVPEHYHSQQHPYMCHADFWLWNKQTGTVGRIHLVLVVTHSQDLRNDEHVSAGRVAMKSYTSEELKRLTVSGRYLVDCFLV